MINRATRKPKRHSYKENSINLTGIHRADPKSAIPNLKLTALGISTPSDQAESDVRPPKRTKLSIQDQTNHCSPVENPSESTPADHVGQVLSKLPMPLRQLQNHYSISTMSIISSSKINVKVRTLRRNVEKPNPDNTSSKPPAVILHAKADVASKMATIVEIAKKAIENEGGKWWQYSTVFGQLEQAKKEVRHPLNYHVRVDVYNTETYARNSSDRRRWFD